VSQKSPLAIVKETFGDKAKLVSAVETLTSEELWVARTNKNKGLAHVSNAKLLRLHATLSQVKEKFGSREKLIDAILELLKRPKDAGLRQKFAAWPVPRLYDTYKVTEKRAAREHVAATPAAKASAPAGASAPAAKKTPGKAAAKTGKVGAKAPAAKKGARR
jgi:hypothetical protein